MNHLFFSALLILALSAGCRNKSAQENNADTGKNNHAHNHEKHHHGEEAGETPVSLNNGEKWQANPETTEGIKKMTGLVKEFPAQPALEDYHALKGKLETEFDQVIKQCTMTGEAHEQLHNYLLPLKKHIDKLGAATIEECQAALQEVSHRLDAYGTYFQ